MKANLFLLSCIASGGLVAGCNQQPTTSQQLDKVQTDTTQAARDMKDYTYAEKDEFVKDMRVRLAALNVDLDTLSAKIDSSSDAVKADAKPKLQALRDQSAKLNQQLADAQNATESTWESVKAGAKKAWDSTQTGLTESRQWLSDKIAP